MFVGLVIWCLGCFCFGVLCLVLLFCAFACVCLRRNLVFVVRRLFGGYFDLLFLCWCLVLFILGVCDGAVCCFCGLFWVGCLAC